MQAAPAETIELSESWTRALRELDDDLRRRAAAEKTRRAYGADVEHFAAWCTARSLEPAAVGVRDLRRYAASLSQASLKSSSLARKIASLRALYRVLRERGEIAQSPAELLTLPKRPRTLPHVLHRRASSRRSSMRSAARRRLTCATARCSSSPTRRACAPRSSSAPTVVSVDFDGERVRIEGKGGKTRFVPVGEPALQAISRYLERARHALAVDAGEAGALPLEVRACALDLGRAPTPACLVAARRARRRRASARPAPLVRDPPARRRR